MENVAVVGVVSFQPASTEREGVTAGAVPRLDPSVAPLAPPTRAPDAEDGDQPPPPASAVDVHGVRARDVAALRRLSVVHRLDQPEALLTPYSPLRAGLTALVPGLRGQRPLFLASANDRLLGFAQFLPVRPDQRWHLVALGAAGGDAQAVWEELLAHGVKSAGGRGVKRLYVRAPVDSPVTPAIRAVGWAPFGTETLFVAYDIERIGESAALRSQEQSDTWAIHQLYNAAVPRQVQYAEAFTSHRWDARVRGTRRNGLVATGWLVEEGHHVTGYARLSSRGSTHVMELVYHPERPDVLDALVDGLVARVPASGAKRLYCAVRHYQPEAARVLSARGFVPVLEQELHIKYTTANVRLPSWETVPFRVEVRDKLPKRVPSFLHGQPRDESAT